MGSIPTVSTFWTSLLRDIIISLECKIVDRVKLQFFTKRKGKFLVFFLNLCYFLVRIQSSHKMTTEKERGERAKERGNDAFKRQDYVGAVGCYTEAILADPENHVYFLNRSMAYMKLNKFEDAERDASASLRLGGDNAKAYFRRGSARKRLSRWVDAKQGEKALSSLFPKTGQLFFWLILAYSRL